MKHVNMPSACWDEYSQIFIVISALKQYQV